MNSYPSTLTLGMWIILRPACGIIAGRRDSRPMPSCPCRASEQSLRCAGRLLRSEEAGTSGPVVCAGLTGATFGLGMTLLPEEVRTGIASSR